MGLRPYQNEAVELVRAQFTKHKRVILAMPTGAGKTVVFSEIAWKTFLKGKRVMILTHRKELLKQAAKFNNNGCEICMVETLNNRIKKGTFNINLIDLLIIDEAHIGSFKKILEHYTGYVIGATATPLAKPGLHNLYSEIVCNVDIPKLIDQGFLSSPRTYVKMKIDTSKLEKKAGEYTPMSLDIMYNKPQVFAGLVRDYVQQSGMVKTIVFCVNVEHTINVHSEFLSQGVEAYCVHSKMSDSERDNQIALFRASANAVLINCGICTTGFDEPDIRLVIVNRATMSLALWLQMCGRGSRVIKGIKSEFSIWDYGENIERLGHWEMDRDWRKLFFKPDKQKGEQAAPIKECPQCRAMVYASAKICPYCKHEFDIASVITPEGELIEMMYKRVYGKKIFGLTYEELLEVCKVKGYKQFFLELILYFKTEDHSWLTRFWDEKGYKDAYRWRRIEMLQTKERPKDFFIRDTRATSVAASA